MDHCFVITRLHPENVRSPQVRFFSKTFLLWPNAHNVKSTTLTTLSVQFSGTKYIYNIMQPSAPLMPITPFILKNWKSIHWTITPHFPLPWGKRPWQALYFLSVILMTLNISHKCNIHYFSFLWLAYFTWRHVLMVHPWLQLHFKLLDCTCLLFLFPHSGQAGHSVGPPPMPANWWKRLQPERQRPCCLCAWKTDS